MADKKVTRSDTDFAQNISVAAEVLGFPPKVVKTSLTVAEALQSDASRFQFARTAIAVAEIIGQPPRIVNTAVTVAEALQSDPSRFEYARVATTVAEVLLRVAPFKNANLVAEVLGTKATTVPPLFTDAVYENVTQHGEIPPLVEIISMERLAQSWCYLTTEMPIDDPISASRVMFSASLSVQASPIVTISKESVNQVWSYAMAASRLGDYPGLDQYRSPVNVKQNTVIVLQSMDIPYTPTSGVFVPTNVMLAVNKRPMERLPRSNVYVAQQATQVVTKQPMPMHRSPVDVGQQLSQVVLPASFEDSVVGVEHVAAVSSYAVVSDVEILPISRMRVPSNLTTALQNSDTETSLPVSSTRVKTLTALELSAVTYQTISLSRVSSLVDLTLIGSDFVPPDTLIVKARAASVVSMATREALDYPSPSIPTATIDTATVSLAYVYAAEYESPEDIFEKSKHAAAAQVGTKSLRSRPLAMPISFASTAQVYEYVTRSQPLLPPDEVAQSGIHVRLITQPVAVRAIYPDATVPVSFLSSGQVLQHIAIPADYPDVHLPTSDGIVSQVVEHVALVDGFPNPEDMFRPIITSQVIEYAAQETQYPEWDTLHKPLEVRQVILHFSDVATYPDKDLPQSQLKVSQVLMHRADTTNYPDKDTPQSALRSRQVLEQVMMRDLSMYYMPSPPRKHRVQISCRFVY